MINQTNPVFANINSYELKIISQDEISKGKALKQYDVNGEKIIGVYENENFYVQFINKSWNRVAVKLSIDGTDVLSGKLADTTVTSEMWICEPYKTLELKAWPESNKGGSEFVFGKPEDSVALNTHGVKIGIGYIAAAIFIEEVQQNFTWVNNYGSGQITFPQQDITWTQTSIYPNTNFGTSGEFTQNWLNIGQNKSITENSYAAQTVSGINGMSTMDNCDMACASVGPAVGAGEYINQEITKVAGLNKPVLNTVINIKYEWWVSLRSKIRALKEKPANPAFPGDQQVTKMIDLKSTPRKKKNKKISNEVKYPELNRFG